jgi:hypothetical protein
MFPQSTAPNVGTAPQPVYSGVFIPTLWAMKVTETFYDNTALPWFTNTDHEAALLKMGEAINIRRKPKATTYRYKDGDKLQFHRASVSMDTLKIDQAIVFSEVVGDIVDGQMDLNYMDMIGDDAAQRMKIDIETEVLQYMKDKADPANLGHTAGAKSKNINLGLTGSPLVVTARDAKAGQVEVIDVITRLAQVLDEQNIPIPDRYLLVPMWFSAEIKRSELRIAALSGDEQSMLRTGVLGVIDRFKIIESNLLPNGTDDGLAAGESVIYAGTKHAVTFATQMTKVQVIDLEGSFDKAIRGLQVYGREVIDGIALAQAVVMQAP